MNLKICLIFMLIKCFKVMFYHPNFENEHVHHFLLKNMWTIYTDTLNSYSTVKNFWIYLMIKKCFIKFINSWIHFMVILKCFFDTDGLAMEAQRKCNQLKTDRSSSFCKQTSSRRPTNPLKLLTKKNNDRLQCTKDLKVSLGTALIIT